MSFTTDAIFSAQYDSVLLLFCPPDSKGLDRRHFGSMYEHWNVTFVGLCCCFGRV